MPFLHKKKGEKPTLGIKVGLAVSTTAEVVMTPRAPNTATSVAQPPPLPLRPPAHQPYIVSLAFPSSPPSPTHLRLRIRYLEADRFIELDVPKEARLRNVKRRAMERFGLVQGDSSGGVRSFAGVAGEKGKERATAKEEEVLNISLPHSASFPALPDTSPSSALSSSTSALHPSTSSPSLSQPKDHAYDDLELTRTFSGPSGVSPSVSSIGRHSRRSSVQSVDITPFSLHRSGTSTSSVQIREDSPSKRFSGSGGASSSASSVALPKRGRAGTTTELHPAPRKMDSERSVRSANESDYSLTNAVMGCRFEESSIAGKVLVQYDLLTLARRRVCVDPPLAEYHRPFLRKRCYLYKPSSSGPLHDAHSALTAKISGRWASRIIEADDRQLSIFKDTGSPSSATYLTSYPLPPTSLFSAPASQLQNLSAPNESTFDPSQSILILGCGERKTCIIRAKNARDFADMMRVLGAERDEGQSFRTEMDEPEWRINAINLAHASRHGQLDPASPRQKLHLRHSFTTSTPLPPSPTSSSIPLCTPPSSSDSSRPPSQGHTPPRTALASLPQGLPTPAAREPRRVLSLRGSKGSVRTPAVVTEDTEGEQRAHRVGGVNEGPAEDEEEERRWESALRSAAARD